MDANFKISAKGWMLVGIPLLTQACFLGVLIVARADQNDAQEWAIHSKEVLAQTQGAFAMSVEARAVVGGYVQTGNPRLLERFQKLRTDAAAAAAVLQTMVQDKPDQQAKAKRLADQIEQITSLLDQAVQSYQAGKIDFAKQLMVNHEGFELIGKLGTDTRDFLRNEEQFDRDRRENLDVVTRRQNWILAGGAVLAVTASVLMVYVFSRGIGRRLDVLMENTRLLAQGKEMLPPLAGRDEICQLDHALHHLAEALVHKDRENEMFVYSVSHDLRSPLVNLQGFSEELALVCKDLRQTLAEETLTAQAREKALHWIDHNAAEAIQYIQTAVSRLAAIIDALLQLSRVGRVEYQMKSVDADATVKRILQSLHDTLTRRHVEVVTHPLPPIWADPTALDQTLANLIGNAVNYLDPVRPGKIEIGCAQGPVEGAPPLTQVYYVKDNGLGIPAEAREKIFLAFHRLHPKAAPGEGIGLALVRRVVERHGGKVWVESTVGVGSTFFIALPQSPQEASNPSKEVAA